MNKLKNFGTFIVMLFAFNLVSAQQDTFIDFSQLPANAQTFIKTHFDVSKVASVWEDNEYLKRKEYSVRLNDGSEIEFYANGDWEEVKSINGVPAKIIPSTILQYVNKQFPKAFIKGIKKRRNGYEVEISNGLDLEFNKKGRFIRIDD